MTYASDGTAVFRPIKSGVVVPAGKVYMKKPDNSGGSSSAKIITIDPNETTAIKEITESGDAVTTKPTVIYDLQGRRVTSPTHGVYIINGKKIYVK